MEAVIKEIIRKIKKTVLADSNGQMALGTKEATCKAISTGKGNRCMQMAHIIKAIFVTINWKVTVLLFIATE